MPVTNSWSREAPREAQKVKKEAPWILPATRAWRRRWITTGLASALLGYRALLPCPVYPACLHPIRPQPLPDDHKFYGCEGSIPPFWRLARIRARSSSPANIPLAEVSGRGFLASPEEDSVEGPCPSKPRGARIARKPPDDYSQPHHTFLESGSRYKPEYSCAA